MRFTYIVCSIALTTGCASAAETARQRHDASATAHKTVRGSGQPNPDAAAPSSEAQSGNSASFDDIQFSMDVTVPAGSEQLSCIYGVMPTDRGVIAVSSAESHFTPGSHHMLAYRSKLTSVPSDQTGVWDCSDGPWQMDERGSYYEAQQPDAQRSLPAGIAHEFQPGEIIILQAHYLNTTTADIPAHVELTLHTTDPAQVQFEAGSIMFNNFFVELKPHEKTRLSLTCVLPQDIHLALLWSHMHSRGINFVATTDDEAAAAVLGALYTETSWSEPTPREYPDDPSIVLHQGSHITFACDYNNDTDNTFVYGNSAATDEMCLLHGMYWPRMPLSSELCQNGKSESSVLQ